MDIEVKPKRKTRTSTAVKQRYIDKTYTQFNCRIRNEEAVEILEYLSTKGLSRAEFVKKAYALMREAEEKAGI